MAFTESDAPYRPMGPEDSQGQAGEERRDELRHVPEDFSSSLSLPPPTHPQGGKQTVLCAGRRRGRACCRKPLVEVRPQERVQRHTAELIIETFVPVQVFGYSGAAVGGIKCWNSCNNPRLGGVTYRWGSVASEAGCQPGVSKGSETRPVMGGLRVALETLSVECRLLWVSDPRSHWHQSPYRRYCGQHYLRAGRRPGEFLGRRGRRGWGGGWSSRSCPRTVLQRFVE